MVSDDFVLINILISEDTADEIHGKVFLFEGNNAKNFRNRLGKYDKQAIWHIFSLGG